MDSFKTYLEEGRDAPLYHATNFESSVSIISSNTLKGNTHHDRKFKAQIEYNSFNDKKNVRQKHFTSKDKMSGISLTRSLKTAKRWHRSDVIFKINQRKLTQNHKVIPINIYAAAGGNLNAKTEELFEEFVLGNIKNFDKYVEYIVLRHQQQLSFLLSELSNSNKEKFKYYLESNKKIYTYNEAKAIH